MNAVFDTAFVYIWPLISLSCRQTVPEELRETEALISYFSLVRYITKSKKELDIVHDSNKEFEMKVATVVDPVGIRAINEVAFFGNYALLNIQLLLFNSYRMYILFLSTVGSSVFKIIEDSEGSFIPESVNPDRNQCPYRWRCVLVEAIAVTVTIENEYFNVLVRACENKSRIRNAPIE
ncbi:hypothetical protein T03_12817 [Trichinella britovi]|uniref:Uncharacterized protein n=1 Tax=Trichinella britovi TaxID=45882 RepID=A0A0V1CRI8_TRIBR|nr:hypothetical protein T03_12817 [Trichinella britovi]